MYLYVSPRPPRLSRRLGPGRHHPLAGGCEAGGLQRHGAAERLVGVWLRFLDVDGQEGPPVLTWRRIDVEMDWE